MHGIQHLAFIRCVLQLKEQHRGEHQESHIRLNFLVDVCKEDNNDDQEKLAKVDDDLPVEVRDCTERLVRLNVNSFPSKDVENTLNHERRE